MLNNKSSHFNYTTKNGFFQKLRFQLECKIMLFVYFGISEELVHKDDEEPEEDKKK